MRNTLYIALWYNGTYNHICLARYGCPEPYNMLDETDRVIYNNEMEMQRIQESASLFELNISEFKQLKQCRRELRMLKVWFISNFITIILMKSTYVFKGGFRNGQ